MSIIGNEYHIILVFWVYKYIFERDLLYYLTITVC